MVSRSVRQPRVSSRTAAWRTSPCLSLRARSLRKGRVSGSVRQPRVSSRTAASRTSSSPSLLARSSPWCAGASSRDRRQALPAVAPRTTLGLGLPLIVAARDQGVNDPVALSGTRRHRPVESVLNGAWGRPERGSQDHVFPGRSTALWARGRRTRLARRSLRLLCPPDGHSLRKLQRADLADAARTPTGISKHLRLLSLVRRLGRRDRRPRAIGRASEMVARRAAGHVPGPDAASGHGCAGRDRLELQDPDRPVRGAHRRVRAGSDGHGIPDLFSARGLLHAIGQPGWSSGAPCGRCVYSRERPPGRRHVHCAATCELLAGRGTRPGHRPDLLAARGSPAIRLSRVRSEGAQVHAGLRRVDELRGRAHARPVRPGACPGAEDSRCAGRRYRPVLTGRPGNTGSNRSPRFRRSQQPPRPDPMDQDRAPGTRPDWPRTGSNWRSSQDRSVKLDPGRGSPGDGNNLERRGAPSGESPVRMEPTLAASYQFCGKIAQSEARNFHCAFRLLPRARRQSMDALYAFMRHTDDLADGSGSAAEKEAALGLWQTELEAALAAEPVAWPGLLALADTVSRWGI